MESQGETSDQTPQTAPPEAQQTMSEQPVESISTLEPPQTAPVATSTAQIPASEPLANSPEPIATPVSRPVRDLLARARLTIQGRKQKKLEKVLALFEKRRTITNDEVEKLLHVSDATATRYLAELEKQGKIAQVGKTGKAVMYTKL